MNRYTELIQLVMSFEKDFVKFYDKRNKTAGIRLRRNMQELRKFAKSIRNEVQMLNRTIEQEESQSQQIAMADYRVAQMSTYEGGA